jgi:hypothetical protein
MSKSGGRKIRQDIRQYYLSGVMDTFTGNSSSLDLSEASKGIYYIQINDQQQVFNQKIIIQ